MLINIIYPTLDNCQGQCEKCKKIWKTVNLRAFSLQNRKYIK